MNKLTLFVVKKWVVELENPRTSYTKTKGNWYIESIHPTEEAAKIQATKQNFNAILKQLENAPTTQVNNQHLVNECQLFSKKHKLQALPQQEFTYVQQKAIIEDYIETMRNCLNSPEARFKPICKVEPYTGIIN